MSSPHENGGNHNDVVSDPSAVMNNAGYVSQQAQRFPAWMALTVFSTVCLAALATHDNPRGTPETWSLAVCCISMILGALSVAAYLFGRAIFVGQPAEGAVLALLLAFWCAALPVLMDPSNEICLRNDGNGSGLVIVNANLYFFSWLCFAATMYLSSSLAQELAGFSVLNTPPQSARWFGLTASSLVVMASAVRAYKSSPTCQLAEASGLEYCKRTKFAIAVGTVSFVLAAFVTCLQHSSARLLQLWVETAFTTLLLVLWCFGVGYITFGDTPGSTISNLFFAAWISFILIVFLFARNFRETVAARQQQSAPGGESSNTNGDTELGTNPTVGNHDF